MKKIIFLMIVLLVGAVGCSSVSDKFATQAKGSERKYGAGSNNNYEWTPSISENIMKIENYLSMDIEFMEGPSSVKITGPEQMVNSIRIRDWGTKMDFTLKPGVRSADFSKVKCFISLPVINEVSLHGSGDFMATNVNATMFNANLLGSGDLRITNLSAPSVKFMLRGSGDVKLGNVECTNIQFLTQGSGDIGVKTLLSTSTQIIIQGSGDTNISQLEGTSLELRLQGSGDIALSNIEVNTVKASSQGSGDISIGGTAAAASLSLQGSGDINVRKLKGARISKSVQGTGDVYL